MEKNVKFKEKEAEPTKEQTERAKDIQEKKYYEEIISKKINKAVIVTNVETNFNLRQRQLYSTIYQQNVTYKIKDNKVGAIEEKTLELIVKEESKNPTMSNIMREHDSFDRELKILTEIIPWIEKKTYEKLSLPVYYASKEERKIILNSTSRNKYITKDIKLGIPIDHFIHVLKSIAKLHAGSVAFFEKNAGLCDPFKKGGFFSLPCRDKYVKLIENTWKNLTIEMLSKREPWRNTVIKSNMKKISKYMQELNYNYICDKIYGNDDTKEFRVLNHGDYWTTNFLFKEAFFMPTEFIMLDFQMSVYTSPVIDLISLMHNSPQIDYIFNIDSLFITAYRTLLCFTMDMLGCTTPRPTEEQLMKAMDEKRGYILFVGMNNLSVKHDEDEDELAKVLGGLKELDPQRYICPYKTYTNFIDKLVYTYESRGYLG